jgi:hypothetical protein
MPLARRRVTHPMYSAASVAGMPIFCATALWGRKLTFVSKSWKQCIILQFQALSFTDALSTGFVGC